MMTKRGRPSLWTQEIEDEILDRLCEGEGLNGICRDDHLPSDRTVRRWADEDRPPGFSRRYRLSRVFGVEHWIYQIVDAGPRAGYWIGRRAQQLKTKEIKRLGVLGAMAVASGAKWDYERNGPPGLLDVMEMLGQLPPSSTT